MDLDQNYSSILHICNKNDKARHGDEQALAITFTRFNAESVALICRLNRNQKEKKCDA